MMLPEETISEKIIQIFSNHNIPLSEGMLNQNIKTELEIDSLGMVDIIVMIEKEFHIPIFDDECSNIKTVNDLVRLVNTKINSEQSQYSNTFI